MPYSPYHTPTRSFAFSKAIFAWSIPPFGKGGTGGIPSNCRATQPLFHRPENRRDNLVQPLLQRHFSEMGPATVLRGLLCPLKMARIGGVKRPRAGLNS